MRFLQSAILAGVCAFMPAAPCMGENIIFPRFRSGISDVSGVVDVVKAYAVDNTGNTDVTAKLQQACDEHQTTIIIYLPNGTYLVSNTITMTPTCQSTTGTGCINGPVLQGQSRTGTVIKLKPNTFTSGGSKAVIKAAGGVAQNFNRGIHNLRVLVGSGNPSADGIFWYANNTGLMSEVDIIAEDGNGNIGVNLGGGEQGPCGARDVYVKGFKTGCKSDALNSVTLWNLTIENASQYGVDNAGNPLYIQNLVCNNAAVGVHSGGGLTLVDARFTGGTSAHLAIENGGQLFARNITAQGYQRAISGGSAPSGLTVSEYSTSQISLFPSPKHSMNLPIEPIPDVPWEQDTTKWANIEVYKGGLGTRLSDSAGLQKAIDDPKITTVCIPAGKAYQWSGDVYVRGNIQRIVGTFGKFNGSGRLVVTNDLKSPVVKIERMLGISLVNQSDKTVIFESIPECGVTSTGTGKLFISDAVGGTTINAPAGRVWAWQFNMEGGNRTNPAVLINDVKTMVIFGWKDEGSGTALVLKKGVVEILGIMNYPNPFDGGTAGETEFVIEDGAQLSIAGETQVSFSGQEYQSLVQETRGGVTKTLTSSQNGGYNFALYTGYDSAKVANAVPVVFEGNRTIKAAGVTIRTAGRTLIISGLPDESGRPAIVSVFSVNGSRMTTCTMRSAGRGLFAIDGLSSGVYAVMTDGGRKIADRVMVP